MDNVENINQKSCSNNFEKMKKALKITSRGRQIVTPKKLLTTSSDEKMKKKKRLIKQKSININKELQDLQQSCSVKPNILKNMTSDNNLKKSKQQYNITFETSRDSVLLRSMSMDNSLLHKNCQQPAERYQLCMVRIKFV